MMRRLVILASLVAFAGGTAGAQPAPAPKGDSAAVDVEYKKKTVYDFEDDLVEGELLRPEGEYINVQPTFKHSSLIKIRQDFIEELIKSAEDI